MTTCPRYANATVRLTNRAIASSLDISLWTVSTHLRRVFLKLGAHNRAEMVAITHHVSGSPPSSQWP